MCDTAVPVRSEHEQPAAFITGRRARRHRPRQRRLVTRPAVRTARRRFADVRDYTAPSTGATDIYCIVTSASIHLYHVRLSCVIKGFTYLLMSKFHYSIPTRPDPTRPASSWSKTWSQTWSVTSVRDLVA